MTINDFTFPRPIKIQAPVGNGTITLNGDIKMKNANQSVELVAGNDVILNGFIRAEGTGAITITADEDGNGDGDIKIGGNNHAQLVTDNGDITISAQNIRMGNDEGYTGRIQSSGAANLFMNIAGTFDIGPRSTIKMREDVTITAGGNILVDTSIESKAGDIAIRSTGGDVTFGSRDHAQVSAKSGTINIQGDTVNLGGGYTVKIKSTPVITINPPVVP